MEGATWERRHVQCANVVEIAGLQVPISVCWHHNQCQRKRFNTE